MGLLRRLTIGLRLELVGSGSQKKTPVGKRLREGSAAGFPFIQLSHLLLTHHARPWDPTSPETQAHFTVLSPGQSSGSLNLPHRPVQHSPLGPIIPDNLAGLRQDLTWSEVSTSAFRSTFLHHRRSLPPPMTFSFSQMEICTLLKMMRKAWWIFANSTPFLSSQPVVPWNVQSRLEPRTCFFYVYVCMPTSCTCLGILPLFCSFPESSNSPGPIYRQE